MFAFSGAAISKLRNMQNGGKRARHSVDQWDRQSTLSRFRYLREKEDTRPRALLWLADDKHRSETALRYIIRLDERSWTIIAGWRGFLLDNMRY